MTAAPGFHMKQHGRRDGALRDAAAPTPKVTDGLDWAIVEGDGSMSGLASVTEGILEENRLFQVPADFPPLADAVKGGRDVHEKLAGLDAGTAPEAEHRGRTARGVKAGRWLGEKISV